MPVTTKVPRTEMTKCYIHEVRKPVKLPYEPHKYHICLICQFRLLEIAKTNFRFERSQQVIRISIQPELVKATV
jgi:hypothetical protein